jgi:GT2 family glycosyltransferase
LSVNDLNLSLRQQANPSAQRAQGGRRARLAVILVNWNRYADTIECLESLLRSDERVRIVVVDNGSTDGTEERLMAWASGTEPYQPPLGPLKRFTSPPLPKPINLRVLQAHDLDT